MDARSTELKRSAGEDAPSDATLARPDVIGGGEKRR